MKEEINQDLYIMDILVSLVKQQSNSCISMMCLSNEESHSPKLELQNIELQKSTSDMLITMNTLITAKLIQLGTEDEEKDFISHSLTVEELDSDYDEDLDD